MKQLVLGFLGAVMGGLIVAACLYFFYPQPYVVDLNGVIDVEREKVLKQIEGGVITQEKGAENLTALLEGIEGGLKGYEKQGKLVLVKDAVLSGGDDITDEFMERIKKE